MKTYPTIAGQGQRGVSVYVFDKLDGSNIRAEWSKKKGFWKFGRRKALLDDSNPHLVGAPGLIRRKYSDDLALAFKKLRVQKAVAFFELWGPQSFAGNHVEGDDITVTLIDVAVHPKGILAPKDFLKHFGHLDHAALLHHGPVTKELEEEVEGGTLAGMTYEGVVCKGPWVSPGRPLMFKIKSAAWRARLKEHCGDDQELFQKLL